MTPEEIVRHHYPHAEARPHPTESSPGGWSVYSGSGPGGQALGSGETQEEAWVAAAAVVQSGEEPESGAGD